MRLAARPDRIHLLSNEITVQGENGSQVAPEATLDAFRSGPVVQSFGGGLEGAQYTSRETAAWTPNFLNPDGTVNYVKATADARARDTTLNDGYAYGGLNVHRDSIVGAQYRLNAKPVWQLIPGATEDWADAFQQETELRFRLASESNAAWLDVERTKSFTAMVRLAIACFFTSGEVTATPDWIREPDRPFKTAVLMFSPDRLCNPNGLPDSQFQRRGVLKDARGKPISYSVRNGDQYATYAQNGMWSWSTFPARTRWGRTQMIHIADQVLPGQTRGVADMVSVLKQMRMTSKFQDITLQNAVINASYAATIESELPDSVLQAAMGSTTGNGFGSDYLAFVQQYMAQLGVFVQNGSNLKIDGAKIPHLYPGTSLNMKPIGTPGGVGQPFEASLLRHIAAGLNISYEELSKDYSQVSYSSARASMANAEKGMKARKRLVADRFADEVYQLWLEEAWVSGDLPMPPGYSRLKGAQLFYKPYMKEAISSAIWVGSGAGQIDELKETQAAILKVQSGLSTYELEAAKLGVDWRDIFAQSVREQKYIEKNGLQFLLSAKRPLGQQAPPTDATSQGS
jgi:lambda family phage portal protein